MAMDDSGEQFCSAAVLMKCYDPPLGHPLHQHTVKKGQTGDTPDTPDCMPRPQVYHYIDQDLY